MFDILTMLFEKTEKKNEYNNIISQALIHQQSVLQHNAECHKKSEKKLKFIVDI